VRDVSQSQCVAPAAAIADSSRSRHAGATEGQTLLDDEVRGCARPPATAPRSAVWGIQDRPSRVMLDRNRASSPSWSS